MTQPADASGAPHGSRTAYWSGAAGALLIAGSAVFVRLAEVSPSTAAVYRCAYALPPLAFLAWLEDRRYGRRAARDRRVALAAGVFFAADLTLWHHSIEAVGAGLATVLGATQLVVTGLVAWALLGERPTARVQTAVPAVLVGVVLISGAVGGGAYGEDPVLGAVFGLLTAVMYSAFILLLRRSNADLRRPAGPLLDASASAAVVAALAGLAVGDLDLAPYWPAHGWLLALALTSQVIAWLLISVSLPRLPAVVTSLLLMLQPVGSIALGIVLLAEAPSPLQLVGVAMVLAAVVFATSRPGVGDRERAELVEEVPAAL